jgi:hypothetical protein
MMSWLNGAQLVLVSTYKRPTRAQTRAWAHAERMAEKRARSPSRVLVREALATWREREGEVGTVYPHDWPEGDFSAQVAWAKAQAKG